MDHYVWQVVPGINNTVREKVFGGINGAMFFIMNFKGQP